MAQWWIRTEDFKANPGQCLDDVRRSRTTIVLTENDDADRQVARIVPEGKEADAREGAFHWSGRRLRPYTPTVRLRGPGTSLDLLREAR